MSSLGRKLKRDKLKDSKKEMSKKIGLFNKIPDHYFIVLTAGIWQRN
jgi:hypothetical protein